MPTQNEQRFVTAVLWTLMECDESQDLAVWSDSFGYFYELAQQEFGPDWKLKQAQTPEDVTRMRIQFVTSDISWEPPFEMPEGFVSKLQALRDKEGNLILELDLSSDGTVLGGRFVKPVSAGEQGCR